MSEGYGLVIVVGVVVVALVWWVDRKQPKP